MSHIAPIKATVVEAVTKLLEEVPKTGVVSFKHLTKGLTDRIEIVVKFLAILELYKQGVLEIDQIDSFGEISVSWCPEAELSDRWNYASGNLCSTIKTRVSSIGDIR